MGAVGASQQQVSAWSATPVLKPLETVRYRGRGEQRPGALVVQGEAPPPYEGRTTVEPDSPSREARAKHLLGNLEGNHHAGSNGSGVVRGGSRQRGSAGQ